MKPPSFITDHDGLWLLSDDTSIRPAVEKCGRLNWDGVFDRVFETLKRRSPRGGVVVDVGAFIGDTTEWFVDSYQCVTFEPQRDAFTCLVHNLPLETHFPYPVGNGEMADLGTETDGPGNLGSRSVRNGSSVKTVRIDDLALPELALLKIDAEGSEPLVLDGAKETIDRCKPLVVVEINVPSLAKRGFNPKQILDRFHDWQGIEIYRFNESQYDMLFVPRT